MKYTKENLQKAVTESVSPEDLLAKLNIKLSHSMRCYILKRIKEHGIDISHFKKRTRSKTWPTKTGWEHFLVKRQSGFRQHGKILTRSLLEYGVLYRCNKCGIDNKWNNSLLVLEINHINHDFLDDTPENLEFLCPNCHSQETSKYSISRKKKKLCDCGNEILKTSSYCNICAYKYREKKIDIPQKIKKEQKNRSRIDWPDNETLHKMVWSMPTKYIAKQLNISDVAISRRCKKFNISKPSKGYWTKVKYGSEENRLSQPVC